MRALQIAATGMDAQQTRVEVISHNIANMSTTGYKARRVDFADLHYQQTQSPGALSSRTGTTLATGVQLGLGVRTASVSILLEQGSIEATSQDFDFALEGDGFFQIEMHHRKRRWRNLRLFRRRPGGSADRIADHRGLCQ